MNKINGTNKIMKNRNTIKRRPSIKGRQPRPIIKKNKTVKRSRNRLGGVAVASGGFGCIFNPALKCKNEKIDTPLHNNEENFYIFEAYFIYGKTSNKTRELRRVV